jgi:hypothetical protein
MWLDFNAASKENPDLLIEDHRFYTGGCLISTYEQATFSYCAVLIGGRALHLTLRLGRMRARPPIKTARQWELDVR